jgi:hypothetical protein
MSWVHYGEKNTFRTSQRAKREKRGGHWPPRLLLCAEHDRQLGGASPLHNQMEVK